MAGFWKEIQVPGWRELEVSNMEYGEKNTIGIVQVYVGPSEEYSKSRSCLPDSFHQGYGTDGVSTSLE